jgi:hypothetical protein
MSSILIEFECQIAVHISAKVCSKLPLPNVPLPHARSMPIAKASTTRKIIPGEIIK